MQYAPKSAILFGGSFDPFHNGHWAAISAARKQFPGTEVILIPAKRSPFKKGHHFQPDVRLAMAREVAREWENMTVSEFDLNQEDASWTIETVTHFVRTGYNDLYLLIGSDQFFEFQKWQSFEGILGNCKLLVVDRAESVSEKAFLAHVETHFSVWNDRISRVPMKPVDVSSTAVRQAIAEGEDVSADVPPCISRFLSDYILAREIPFVIGLTGRAGSGKSYSERCIASHFDVDIIDLDLIGHAALETPEIRSAIRVAFGDGVMSHTGEVDRKKLGPVVFSDAMRRTLLNKIVHPKIKELVEYRLAHRKKKTVVINGALIEEIGLAPLCQKMMVIEADDNDLSSHSGERKAIIAGLQRSQEDYAKTADVIIHNNFEREALEAALVSVISAWLHEAGRTVL